jgi:hypothetical protein
VRDSSKNFDVVRDRLVVIEPQPVPEKAAAIAECSIDTDSVVATATLRTDTPMRRVIVQWGDGQITTLRDRPGVEAEVGHEGLPSGTYRLSHVYDAPDDHKPFAHDVIVRVEDASGGVDFCIRHITLIPRYRVTNYQTYLTLESKCDSWFENRAEFDIIMYVDDAPFRAWKWSPYESSITTALQDYETFVLDTRLVRELTYEDNYVPVYVQLTEVDPVLDDVMSFSQNMYLSYESETIEDFADSVTGSSCDIRYRYDREVTLVVPLPSTGQEIVVKG